MVLVGPLLALGTLALVLWVIACALAIAVVLGYISGALAGLPWPFNKIAGPVKSLSQSITGACGKLESGVDRIAGAAWHLFARYLDKQWHQIEQQAALTWAVINHVVPISAAIHRLEGHVKHATSVADSSVPRIKRVEREFVGIEHGVKNLERRLYKGIDSTIRGDVKPLRRDLTRLENQVIPGLREDVATAERDVSALRKWVTDHVPLIGSAAFVGAIAAALSALGLGWLRCESNPFNNNKEACALWGDLSGLLGVLATVIAVEDFQELVKEMQSLEQDVATGLQDLLNV